MFEYTNVRENRKVNQERIIQTQAIVSRQDTRQKTSKIKSTTQNTKRMSNMDPKNISDGEHKYAE